MVKENIRPNSNRQAQSSLDLDISAVLISERLIGEIFGWDLVDWSAIERHKGRKFFFGRQRKGDPSIHDHLKPYFDRCDPSKNDFSPLKPSPILNANLSRLVDHLCRHIGKHELTAVEAGGSPLVRTLEQDQLHLAVVERLLDRIGNSASLGKRAARLKRIAASAESELEKHFADLINERLESSFLQGGLLDPCKIRDLRDQARQRLEETCLLNKCVLAGLSVPDLALDDEALARIEMAKILLNRFPYVRNYELMLLAELAMLQQPLRPRFARERMLSSRGGTIQAALIERWDEAVARMASFFEEPRKKRWRGSLADRTIAVCGSGPLPMSALFLHLLTGASIVLVDEDGVAVRCSRRLIVNLERMGILGQGALTVLERRAGDVTFHDPTQRPKAACTTAVACDAVMIASLVDAESKASIAEQFASNGHAPQLLIMRSATGLSAKLAYDPIPTEAFCRGNLVYCGETVPATQVATHLNRFEAISRGVACTASPDVLAIAHPDVVNTTEIFQKVLINNADACDFGGCTTIEGWIEQLECTEKRSALFKA